MHFGFMNAILLCGDYRHVCGPGYLSRYSDSVGAGRSRDRILVEARFYAPV